MASGSGSVWAIDLGNNSLKALRLSNVNGAVTVTGFDSIEHEKILNIAGVKTSEKDELIALSIRKFIQQNDIGKDDVIVAVPSQSSFARFVKLPPVEKKRIPEIVKFEAAQQIPFDLNDVQWDWQVMSEPEDTEQRVGIFAIKNDVVMAALEHYSRQNMRVRYVQMSPMAIYNFVLYDRAETSKGDNQAVVIVDIGCENTDLVVCTKTTVWQRCIPMGGNAFTKAVAEAFKLNFDKAEKLKRTAAMSKYARQIFQAMRPVFTDLASEIQRSLGFYTSSNAGVKLTKVVAMGGGTKMRGLLQYIQQTLQIPVEKPDSFLKLSLGSEVSAAKFHENVGDFGVVYGLGIQGLGLGRLVNNLLPRSIARSMTWTSKSKYFTIAACLLLGVSLLSLGRTVFDKITYKSNGQIRQKVKSIIDSATAAQNKVKAEQGKASGSEAIIQKVYEPFKYREIIPLLQQTILSVLPNEKNNPGQQELYKAFDSGDVKGVTSVPRNQRKQVFITGVSINFSDDIANAVFGERTTQKSEVKKSLGEESDYEGIIPTRKITSAPSVRRGATSSTTAAEGDAVAGFVVTITGYSPYKNIGELMDPIGVENDPNKWGVITRLLHLKEVIDGNSPFELFKKTEVSHFKLEISDVGFSEAMPVGIGVLNIPRAGAESAIVDPMTREVISKEPEYDEYGRKKTDKSGNVQYKANDHWFRLDCKFKWIDAPKLAEAGGGQ